MKRGFTILEISIVILISAIVSMSLYQLFRQTIGSVRGINAMIDQDTPLMPFYNQLERDITGMFAPQASIRGFLEELKKKKQPVKQDMKAGLNPQLDKSEAQKTDEPKPKKFLKNIFFIESKDPGSLVWSFITTNGIQSLESDGSVTPQPAFFRVAYIIKPDPNEPGTSQLMYRASTKQLELDAITSEKFEQSYVLLSGLKRMTVECTVYDPQKQEAQKPGEAQQEKQKKKSVALKAWKEADIIEKYKTLIPAYVRITGTYTDRSQKREFPFEFEFKVFSYHEYSDKPLAARQRLQSTTSSSKNILEDINKFVDKAVVKPMLAMGKKPPLVGGRR